MIYRYFSKIYGLILLFFQKKIRKLWYKVDIKSNVQKILTMYLLEYFFIQLKYVLFLLVHSGLYVETNLNPRSYTENKNKKVELRPGVFVILKILTCIFCLQGKLHPRSKHSDYYHTCNLHCNSTKSLFTSGLKGSHLTTYIEVKYAVYKVSNTCLPHLSAVVESHAVLLLPAHTQIEL